MIWTIPDVWNPGTCPDTVAGTFYLGMIRAIHDHFLILNDWMIRSYDWFITGCDAIRFYCLEGCYNSLWPIFWFIWHLKPGKNHFCPNKWSNMNFVRIELGGHWRPSRCRRFSDGLCPSHSECLVIRLWFRLRAETRACPMVRPFFGTSRVRDRQILGEIMKMG